KPVEIQKTSATSVGHTSRPSTMPSSYADRSLTGLSAEVVQQVRQLLNQGYKIGTEHADKRRFSSGVWQTCSPIQSTRETEVLSALDACLHEHAGEYVRMFGIDPSVKRRVATTTIQRGDGKPVELNATAVASAAAPTRNGDASGSSAGQSAGLSQQVRHILAQGNKIGVEYADRRRYRSGVWQTAPAISSTSATAAADELSRFLDQHPDAYVRIFGINSAAKQRTSATTIQKPGSRPQPITEDPPVYNAYPDKMVSQHTNGNGGHSAPLGSDLAQQVTQLINQGYRISTEYADQRRYRSGAWQTGDAIEARRPADAIAALEAQLAEHQGHYVRLVGIDPQAKRRVLETTIQRP
ncbi:MAG: acetyltransferase, partial [Leptolyngbya sp. SIO4C1]|nr:acetyltransferase [Leptolyngbya sp. SIO4C1]